jgi:hypothetical protein
MAFWKEALWQQVHTAISRIWQKRHKRLRRRLLLGFLSLAVVTTCVWWVLHWSDPDKDLKITHFLAAFWPIPFGVFAAFFPDMERSQKMRPLWRIGIVVATFCVSGILVHQQAIDSLAAKRSQDALIEKLNSHTDQQVGKVQENLTNTAEQSAEHISALRDGLQATDSNLTDLSDRAVKGFQDLGVSISKVGKPEPPIPAQLQFSLWPGGTQPLLLASSAADKDGAFSVDFTVKNNSPTAVHSADVWINICLACVFTKEPDGSDRPKGLGEKITHMALQILNPGATVEKKTLSFKFDGEGSQVQISMRYSCEVCVSDSLTEQVAVLRLAR